MERCRSDPSLCPAVTRSEVATFGHVIREVPDGGRATSADVVVAVFVLSEHQVGAVLR